MNAVALRPGSWPPSPGLEPWAIFDLELVGPGQVFGGDAEPRRRDLLDLGVVTAAVRARPVPRRVLAALAGVGGPARALDADGQGLMRLGR